MATKSSTAVGSAKWISAERQNIFQQLQQEKEEIIFPAQHELEWLNEHMAEIFSTSQFNVADVFKTPGKLRGKTPRTARKRPLEQARTVNHSKQCKKQADKLQPLTDIFASTSHAPPSPSKRSPLRQSNSFAIAQNKECSETVQAQQELVAKAHTDSGYRGSSQYEMNVDVPVSISHGNGYEQIKTALSDVESTLKEAHPVSYEQRTTEGSFHSAQEEQTAKIQFAVEPKIPDSRAETELPNPTVDEAGVEKDPVYDVEMDDVGSPSDESTPDRPLVRKSSLTFAALPAREPMSIGARPSRTSQVERTRASSMKCHTDRLSSKPKNSIEPFYDHQDIELSDNENIEILGQDDSDSDSDARAAKLYKKSSTQRLHEKINMLGKAPPPRPSKSIPSALNLAASYVRQPEAISASERDTSPHAMTGTSAAVDNDDDWIKPLASPQSSRRPMLMKSYTAEVVEGISGGDTTEDEDEKEEFDLRAPELIAYEERLRTPMRISPSPGKALAGFGNLKSVSTATLVSPGKANMGPTTSPAKPISVSNPSYPSTTPRGSPKRVFEGPLSASKSKLQSIMKTAKGLFTSSAGVSAAAKMETLSPQALRMAAENMPGLYPSLGRMLDDKPLPASPNQDGRSSRSPAERETEEKWKAKDAKVMPKMDSQLEKAREKEKQKVAHLKQSQERIAALKSARAAMIEENASNARTQEMPAPISQMQTSKMVRPTKPSKETGAKTRPQPVSIRIGTLSQRMPISTSSLAPSMPETMQSEPKRPGLATKASTASLQSVTSMTGFKSSVQSQPAKPKALLTAEKKREQDEREAQRKLDQKRDIERKRAAQQEEAKRKEQRERAEADRKERERIQAEQAKRQAQQQAIERKRLENARKAEQQRGLVTVTGPSGPGRPASRMGGAQPLSKSLLNHALPTNPAKPAKRPLDDDTGSGRPQAPKFGAASQQADAKRRRTEDESIIEMHPRPTMSGAPIRQSNLGKKPSLFSHSTYTPAPQPPHIAHNQSQMQQFPPPPSSSMHRVAHPTSMAQFANGAKIPFAEAPNPPQQATKTPAPAYAQKQTLQMVRSSPHYPNGEGIALPEIPTDSEDEDSETDNAFPIPDWATPGHLTDQLMRQEGMDGDAVFGPIAPLKMEEIFAKGNKERLKRMRERTSSANWAMSGDGLTLEEVRVDREMRERMRLEGGWRYGT